MQRIKRIDGTYLEIDNTLIEDYKSNPYNYWDAICNQFEDNLYSDFIKSKNLTILDLGANVGLFDVHISPKAKHIYAVEPLPRHNKIKKVLTEGLPITHIEEAINGYTGTCKFYECEINFTMSSIQNRYGGFIEVPCITLPDLLDKYNLTKVNFCKIDIEGSEHTAITVDLLKAVYDKIDKIFIELHPPDGITQDKFALIFGEAGYKVKKCFHDSLYCTK